MAKCTKCGSEVHMPQKKWELKGGKARKTVVLGIFLCPSCNTKFRATVK
jgi:DNA-directed RNA polymerase subunit RPC12/RpoP